MGGAGVYILGTETVTGYLIGSFVLFPEMRTTLEMPSGGKIVCFFDMLTWCFLTWHVKVLLHNDDDSFALFSKTCSYLVE